MSQILPPRPKPQVSSPKRGGLIPGRQRRAPVDELPPSARTKRKHQRKTTSSNQNEQKQEKPTRRKTRRAWTFLAAAVLGLALWPWGQGESGHRNWAHHEQATSQWTQAEDDPSADPQPMKWVHEMGPATFTNVLPVGIDDYDKETSNSIRSALYQGDPDEAERILREAQKDLVDAEVAYAAMVEGPDEAPAKPSISHGMHRAILNGDASCFHIYLYDSCDEDGDIVDLEVNGLRFATVPITHAGTTLSVPFSTSSATTVVIRGIWDGGGGITVACQTSQGQGFIRVMQPGEEQVLAVVVGK